MSALGLANFRTATVLVNEAVVEAVAYPVTGSVNGAVTGSFIERRINGPRETGPKPVDMTYLHRFTGGDRTLEREVLYLFAQSAPMYIENMRSATDAKGWKVASHTLKGSARAVGAWRVARAAESAEKICFDDDLDRRAFLIDTAEEACDEAIGYIVRIFPET
jgi:HPt (histidine-containing phosphotransfer) domain-containing protein